jgi:hypothetical protein
MDNNVPGTWTNEGDFFPADGSKALHGDHGKCCLRDHMAAKAPWSCPCECHKRKSEPEAFTPEQEERIAEMIADATRELEGKVQRLEQRAGEDTESWQF